LWTSTTAESPRYVETLQRRGYRFIGHVGGAEPVGAPAVSAPKIAVTAVPAPATKRRPFGWTLPVVGVVVVVAALAVSSVGGWRQRLLGRSHPPRIQSIAVLPLENLTGDSSQEYFVDGMTDSLITDLAQVSALRVISRTSVMRYKGAKKPLPEIARELNVEAVVEGSVVRSSNRVRINSQLIQAVPEHHMWANAYERDLADVVALQGDVARAIATEIQIKLTPQEQTRLARVQRLDPEALEAYLKGLYEWNKWTEESLKKSIEYFEQAVQKDPNYAQAWTGLSDAYGLLGDLYFWAPQVALPKAKAAALKALELDETLSQAHVSLGGVMLHLEWSWSAAEKESQRAIALNPNNAAAHQWHGYYLVAMGRFDDAVAEMKRARELDPLSPNKQQSLANTLYRAGRYDEALQQFREVPDPYANPELRHRRMAAIYERKGMPKEAIAELLTALRLAGKKELAAVVERKCLSSGYPEGKKTFLWGDLREKQQRARNGFIQASWIAADYALLGEKDKAFEWLEKAFRERDVLLVYLKVEDSFEPLRSDPRFQDLLRRMGLPP
jgi:TolB-like protein